MMEWVLSVDTALFRFINRTAANPFFDWLMPRLAGHALFLPVLMLLGILCLWRGGRRGRVFILLFALSVGITDGVISNTVKHAVARPRPCIALADTRCLIGCSNSGSMPSSHAANWFAGTAILFIFYRRSWKVMLPAAALISFSRVYDGVHYPADVIAGAIIGAGTACTVVWGAEVLWRGAGAKYFPLWWRVFPSLVEPEKTLRHDGATPRASLDDHWLRLGYLLAGALFLFRLAYIASGTIELSKDEAYQWLWSKHLDISYYSKPPGIALIQFAGTHLWGDRQFGIRFFSPVFAFVLSIVTMRFLRREANGRAAFCFLLILSCAPLMGVGSILMTIDPPLVMCWMLAITAGWQALKPDGGTGHWIFAGLFAALGFLTKYTAAYLVLCWALYFVLFPPARAHLKRPGPYLALILLGAGTLPVIIWNAQHNWITLHHVADNAGIAGKWKPTLRYFIDFVFAETALLNPVFFIAALCAMAAAWKLRRQQPLWLYFFCMGAPVFLGHLAYSFHSRIQPNWIAPAIVPMFCLAVLYWESRWREKPSPWMLVALRAGVILGLLVIIPMHQTDLIAKITGRALPGEVDPLRRVRAWKETTRMVEEARQNLLTEGKPVFIIADHYGMAGLFSFYLPEAKAQLKSRPLVYRHTSHKVDDQLSFWPEYHYRDHRAGENAIYVIEVGPYPLERGWLGKWLAREPIGYEKIPPPPVPPPAVREEFESIKDLGQREIKIGSRVFRRVELFECRNLKS